MLAVPIAASLASCERAARASQPALARDFANDAALFVGAGDIAWCERAGAWRSSGAARTARLLDSIPGTVFTVGDHAYVSGTPQEFAGCYAPTWGRQRARTRPALGNHDHGTPNAAGYFAYFGDRAPGAWYAYDVGAWRAIALDSWSAIFQPLDGERQLAWLREELAAHPRRCTVAYFHHPLFTSDDRGGNEGVRALWDVIDSAGVDLVVNGHDHFYERFPPRHADGAVDQARGIRQFIVGTGGAPLSRPARRAPHSERLLREHGLLALALGEGEYRWRFLRASGDVADEGSGRCH